MAQLYVETSFGKGLYSYRAVSHSLPGLFERDRFVVRGAPGLRGFSGDFREEAAELSDFVGIRHPNGLLASGTLGSDSRNMLVHVMPFLKALVIYPAFANEGDWSRLSLTATRMQAEVPWKRHFLYGGDIEDALREFSDAGFAFHRANLPNSGADLDAIRAGRLPDRLVFAKNVPLEGLLALPRN